MEIEKPEQNGTDENEVVEEIDVYIRVPKKDLYMLHYPMRPSETGLSKYETIQYIQGKPLQNKLNIGVSVSSECENYARTEEGVNYEFESKVINNRTNYCVGKIDKNNLVLIPVNYNLQMRKSFLDLDEKFKDPKKAKKEEVKTNEKKDSELQDVNTQFRRRENLKQIERKLRTYNFQKELLDSEPEVQLRYAKKESLESKKFVQNLLDPPVDVEELKSMDKNEYLKYLF